MAHPSLLYDEMSGMENLRYFAGLYGIAGDGALRGGDSRRRARSRADASRGAIFARHAAADVAGAGDSARSEMLLLDEPFSNVDVHSAREMVGLLKGMRDAGKTIFVVTHQALLLEGVADEFVWMEAGRSSIARRVPTLKRRGSAMKTIPSSPWAVTFATLKKDIRLEWRSKDAINSMLFFSLLVVVIFSFSFDPNAEESRADCRRAGLGGVSVRGRGGAQPDLGARDAQSCAGRVPGLSGSREFAVPG